MIKEQEFNEHFEKTQSIKKKEKTNLIIKEKTMKKELSKIVHLKDGTTHEVCVDSSGKQFIEIKNKKFLYPSQVKDDIDHEEEITDARMRVQVHGDDWSRLDIRFNLNFWKEIKHNTFVMEEDDNGFSIEVFEPVSKTDKTFSISKHNRDIVFPSEIIDCETDVWYSVTKLSSSTYRVNIPH